MTKAKTVIVTDSNSGITQSQAEEYGIYVVPMPFTINGVTYYEEINLSQDEFYKMLSEKVDVCTSTPASGTVTDLWDTLLKEYEGVVHIPMSSGLSASCEMATLLAEDYGGRVQVADNKRISVTLRQSVLDAKALVDAGCDAAQIKEHLERVKLDSSIYLLVNTLEYLKKGGRLTPAAAAIGTLLNIKPVLRSSGDRLEPYAKARGVKQAKEIMIEAIKKEFAGRFADCCSPDKMWLQMAYSYDSEAAQEFKSEVETAFPGYEIIMNPISLSVACHIGPGALAVACTKKLDCNL